MTVVKSLKTLAKVAFNVTDIGANDTIDEILDKISGGAVFGSSNVTPSSPAASKEYWGTKVSAMQTSVSVANGAITGTLHKLTSGSLVDVWGEGYFLALKFTKDNANATSIKVGLRPSVSSGLVELDEDMDGVFKITDKDAQLFVIQCSNGEVTYTKTYDLSGLTLDAG